MLCNRPVLRESPLASTPQEQHGGADDFCDDAGHQRVGYRYCCDGSITQKAASKAEPGPVHQTLGIPAATRPSR